MKTIHSISEDTRGDAYGISEIMLITANVIIERQGNEWMSHTII